MAEPFFGPQMFGTELFFTVIAVIFCFFIYFKTKESYDLTKHEGIRYFRDAFLFLGLSYVLRFLLGIMMFSRFAFDFILPREMSTILFILPLGYFSTIGIFYLIHGSIWKKFNNRNFLILSHGIAIILSIVSFVMRTHLALLFLQFALLTIVLLLNFIAPWKRTKMSQTKILYILVAALWLINLLSTEHGRPFPPEIGAFFQVISLIVFAVIYYKVLKWTK
jgi:hypothetical protein